jgi:putative transposase
MSGYQSNNNITYKCNYHVVFTPKYRRKVLKEGVDIRLKEIILAECELMKVNLIELEIMPEHVHLLIGCDPQVGIDKVIKQLKGRSSNLLRKEFPWLKSRIPSLWTRSYFVATVGSVSVDMVKQYILDQKK